MCVEWLKGLWNPFVCCVAMVLSNPFVSGALKPKGPREPFNVLCFKDIMDPFCALCGKGTVEPFSVWCRKGPVEPFCVLCTKGTV